MNTSIYKRVEEVLGRTIGSNEFTIIENWNKYPEEYIVTCIEIARTIPTRINVRYIDAIMYNHYSFYITLLEVQKRTVVVDPAPKEEKEQEFKDRDFLKEWGITDG